MRHPLRARPTASKTIAMRFERDHVLPFAGFSRRLGSMPILLLVSAMSVIGPPTRASDAGDASTLQQQPSAESREQKDEPSQTKNDAGPELSIPSAAPNLCDTLAMTAMTNDLPIDFFTRLIWQESRFKPDAVSPKGAQGIAQFMPATARLSGLEDPFNPIEAIAKSGQLLQGLRRQFGNLGLAAAAYNAGPGRVRDWLGGIRTLPQETRTYVWLVTGRSPEEWAAEKTDPVGMSAAELVPCNLSATASIAPHPNTPKSEIVKPWGVEVVGGPTPAKALASYREWQPKYAAIVADREPHIVIRGIIGQMGAARVRVGEDTQDGAKRLCAALKAAGAYCDVMRN
ncbi:lytic transglycosylase domain-containing protein [Bradyrhizobium sp. STM 3557]|uniref:lytic transglycosylase domain-containing protein n=1 Tax=Bradyrhizobium sp. STM 3557 TaxID=578920 RepID=UPI00388ED3EE